jgi:branched-chain amino acid transport system permease protein/urea transport system permease protein
MRDAKLAAPLTFALWVMLALAPIVLGEWSLTQLAQYMAYGIFAMGLAFIWGRVGILSFGQAIFFGIGGYSMGLVSLDRLPFLGDNAVIGLLLALIVPAIVAYILGRLLFLGRGLSGAYFAIVTLSAAVVAQTLAEQWNYLGGFNGLLGIPPFTAPWHRATDAYMTARETYYLMLIIAVCVFVGLLWLVRSPVGTVLAAIREDDRRTAFFGYDVSRYKVGAFVTSAVISGAAGALFARQFGFVSPSLIGFGLSTEVLIWVAVGGRQVLMAAFLGALLVRWVEGLLSERLGNFWLLALGLLFAATVVLMPYGLFGRALTMPIPKRLRNTSAAGRATRIASKY